MENTYTPIIVDLVYTNFESNLLKQDGKKIDMGKLSITAILATQKDVEGIINQLEIIKHCFKK
jgi:hypothetical protein